MTCREHDRGPRPRLPRARRRARRPTSRSSTARASRSTSPPTEMAERDEGLIRFLMRDRHGSPFEHGYFRFLVKAPIFVVREHHRHRAGTATTSGQGATRSWRPSSTCPDYVRTQVGKPGAYTLRAGRARRCATRHASEIEARGRAGVRGVRADARAGRREGGRAHRAAARDVHEVLLELQPALADALLLAAQLRVRAVRDPASTRRPPRRFLERADAGHARGVRRRTAASLPRSTSAQELVCTDACKA